jgi:hypothetical protein
MKSINFHLILILIASLTLYSFYGQAEAKTIIEEEIIESSYKKIVLKGPENFLIISKIEVVPTTIPIKAKVIEGMRFQSEYFMVLKNKNNEEIYRSAIGNPFFMEVFFEDGPRWVKDNNAYIEAYYPTRLEPKIIEINKGPIVKPGSYQQLTIMK